MTFLRSFCSMFLIGITVGLVGSCGDGGTTPVANAAVEGARSLPAGSRGATTGAAAPATAAANRIIASARTPDGRAIPQGADPGGACPDVVAVVGFWSCVTTGDTCSYASDGRTHHCSCSPGQGKGSHPAWTCS